MGYQEVLHKFKTKKQLDRILKSIKSIDDGFDVVEPLAVIETKKTGEHFKTGEKYIIYGGERWYVYLIANRKAIHLEAVFEYFPEDAESDYYETEYFYYFTIERYMQYLAKQR